jgi:ATP-dependent helicase/DNAse subunit B
VLNLERPQDGKAAGGTAPFAALRNGFATHLSTPETLLCWVASAMPLNLIHGPPNSGRAGLIRQRFGAVLEQDPVLVVPTIDDVYSFEQEISEDGAVLGAAVMTFGGLFRAVVTAAGAPAGAELTPAQRLGAVSAAAAEKRAGLGPLGRSALHPGFALALERLLDELQEAGLEPADLEAGAGSLESSAYLGDVAALFSGYTEVRDRLGLVDSHGIAREAIRRLRDSDEEFWQQPVFLYGLDDLTRNQLELIASLARRAEVTVALPYESGNSALAARSSLLDSLREAGVASETVTAPDPGNTGSPLLFHLERNFGAAASARSKPDASLTFLRAAGERAEAETIGAEAAKLILAGADPAEIAVVVREPSRRGPLLASILESYGVPVALEARIGVGLTAVGSGLIALLEAMLGAGRAADLLRYLRAASGLPSGQIDSFERAIRRRRVQDAATAVAVWEERFGELPSDLTQIRATASRPQELAREVGRIATAIGARQPSRGAGGTVPAHCANLEQSAAAAISNVFGERAELAGLAPSPTALARTVEEVEVRAWSGPVGSRVRIADPYRLRAARFDHVFVASLQDGEFPRRDGRADPFLSEAQRESLVLPPRRDTDAEERYLFHACLALPRKQLFLSYRDSDENGTAEARSPLLDDVRRMLAPAPDGEALDPVEDELTKGRDLAQVVHRVAEAPSETDLARAIAAHGPRADADSLLSAAEADDDSAARVSGRLAAAQRADAATRAPGPLSNPVVIEALSAVPAYGGTTLEGFDLCSYRWLVSHELDPQPLDPVPDGLIQGGVMHAVLDRLYGERPAGDPLPRPGSLGAWIERGIALVGEIAAERELGAHPAERAIVRRVEGLLARFLAEEAGRNTGGFEPWLLEAGFGEAEEAERPILAIDDWGLHGAIDRVDRAADGQALVLDYKLSSKVTPGEKLEEQAKLQLQLYMIAVAEHWSADVVGGLYHPLRGTSERRPRGVVLEEAAERLASYGLARTDVVEDEGFEKLLADARRRAGTIVARMRRGEIRRDPGPRAGLRGHGVCPPFCDFAPICRRDRAPAEAVGENGEEP